MGDVQSIEQDMDMDVSDSEADDGFKVAKDVANEEFGRFVEEMDLDVDPEGMDDDDKATLTVAKRRFVRAVRRGTLSVNSKGEPVMRTSTGRDLVFGEPEGSAYMAQDGKKAGHDIAKSYAVLANMTGAGESTFKRLQNREVKLCLAILALFLGG